MDTMLQDLQSLFEGKIDFVGQVKVEQISRIYLIAMSIAAFIVGFALQNLRITFYIFGVACTFLAVLVLPPWPMYNAHPVKWLPPVSDPQEVTKKK